MILLSIMPSDPSTATYVITGILSLLMIISVWNVRKAPHRLSNLGVFFSFLLCLLYYLFPMAGTDFYDYKEFVETIGHVDVHNIPQYYLHYEKPYYYIINFVHNDYFLFRLVVWGGSLLLYWQTAKRLSVDTSAFLFFLCICIVPLTSTSRVCLANAIAFYGFSYTIEPITRKGSRTFSFAIGIFLILFSTFFHRSAIFLAAMLPLSLINFNKKTIWLFALAIPTVVVSAYTDLFNYIFTFDQADDSLLDSETAIYYLDSTKVRVVGLGQRIEFFLKYGSHITIVILIVTCIRNRSYGSWPKYVQRFTNATLLITVISAAILLAPGAVTYKTFERLIAFAYVPQSFLLSYLLKMDYEKKITNIVIFFLLGYAIYRTLYYQIYFGFDAF